jgi:membrane protein
MSAAKKKSRKSYMDTINRVSHFLTKELWSIQLENYRPIARIGVQALRVIMLAYRGFVEDRVLLRASALTYYTLMAIVPVLAMAFGIAKGFGLDKYLENQLYDNFQNQQEVIDQLIGFSTKLLDNTGGGIMAGVGVIVLFWSVLKVFGQIEHSFNDIWQIGSARPFSRKFADYLSMMVVAPVLMIAASGMNVFIATQLDKLTAKIELLSYVTPLIMFSLKFLPYFIIWIVFAMLYVVMPNTKVKPLSGIIGGIIAGSAFIVTQWLYIEFQVGVSKNNAIYGSFAALPLLLIWLRVSWLIVLFGAEISFSHQNQNLYEFENETETISDDSNTALSILLLNCIIKRFVNGEPPLIAQELSKELKLPIRLVRSLLDGLVNCNIVSKTYTKQPKTPAFQPAQHIDKLTIAYVIQSIEGYGAHITLDNPTLERINKIHEEFSNGIRTSPQNILVKDL